MSDKLFRTIWLALFGLAFLVSCTQETKVEPILLQGKTMGTTFSIKYFPTEQTPDANKLLQLVNAELVEINQLMSTYIPNSELSLLNKQQAGVKFPISEATAYVLKESMRINQISNGAFDVTVGPLVNLWGFGPNGRVTKRPSEEQLLEVRQWIGADSFTFNDNAVVKKHDKTYIDFSAIAKGYGADVVADLISTQGVNSYLVEIGGELRINGEKPDGSSWSVAIEKPVSDSRQVQLIFQPGNMGMATSGDYRNYFEENGIRFSHTIDINTGEPITHNLVSVTVLHESAATADAVATAINVMGAEKGLALAEKHNIAVYMLVKSDNGFTEVVSTRFKPFLAESKKLN